MPDARIINTRAGWLYETTTSAAPTNWAAVVFTDGVMNFDDIASGYRLFRVTADGAQFGADAYTVQLYTSDWTDAATVSLNVPDGSGTYRIDAFQTNNGSLVDRDTIDQGHHRSRLLYEQQVEIERLAGGLLDYHGNVLRCVESGNTETKELEEGGILEGYDLTLTTNRKQWADLGIKPIVGATLTKGGKRYKIQQLLTNDASFELGLMKKQ